jgi:hypothetical protein
MKLPGAIDFFWNFVPVQAFAESCFVCSFVCAHRRIYFPTAQNVSLPADRICFMAFASVSACYRDFQTVAVSAPWAVLSNVYYSKWH